MTDKKLSKMKITDKTIRTKEELKGYIKGLIYMRAFIFNKLKKIAEDTNKYDTLTLKDGILA